MPSAMREAFDEEVGSMKGFAGRMFLVLGSLALVCLVIALPLVAPMKAQDDSGDAATEEETEAIAEATESDIQDVLDAWNDALADSDVEALHELLEEDAIFLPQGQAALEGAPAILSSYRALFAQYETARELEVDEIRIGGDWAIVRGSESFRLQPVGAGDELEAAPRRILTILHRDEEGTWRFARAMTNREMPQR